MVKEVGYLYALGALMLTVSGQLIMKSRIITLGPLPNGFIEKLKVLLLFF